ncbi:hypothetical protein ES703_38090 [subsurface metagenome]
MSSRLTQADSLCPPPKYPNLDHPFNVCTGSSRRPTPTSFEHLRKPELSPEDLKTIEEIREKGKGLAPEVLDSLVRGFVESKLRGVSPGADAFACAVGSERSGVEPGPGPGPGPGEKKAVATAPKKRAKVKRLNVAPADVVKYFRKEQPLISWEPVLRAMYFVSWYDAVKRRRIFNRGVEWLAAWSGFSERQVRTVLARMKVRRVKEKKRLAVKGIIKLRRRGWPGEGCSPWELPCNMGLVMRWRRNLPKK